MKNYKLLKISSTKKLRYIVNYTQNHLYVVFLHGFASDIEGKKPKIFNRFAIKNKIGFLAMEYSGHGKSSGEFTRGNISTWTKDAEKTIKKILKKNNFILIGSSMGAWISLNLFKNFKKQIKGFLGIGSAPEFLTYLMWNKFPKKVKNEIINKGIYKLKNGQHEYLITHQLIKDGRKNKVLNKSITSKIPITMVHGSKDEVVPKIYSKKILTLFPNAKKKLKIINNGDHSLSSNRNLKIILKELSQLLKKID
jgi:pimeloyl-ACP methyl ester carboxylesterase|tara:strand:- start:1920 stop:2675 length:756 start_codon:yes stop_codon:yes gene_type:complete